MVFGYSTNAFVKYSLIRSLEMIAELGFKGAEIMCDHPHLYPPDTDAQEMTRIRRALERLELTVTNLNSFTLFAVGDTHLPSWIEEAEERRRIRIRHTLDCLETAKALGCANISVPPGGPLGTMPRTRAFTHFHHGLEQVIPRAEELGIRLLIEPEPDLLIERTSEFKPFIRDIRSDMVGLNFDIGHFFCAGEDPAAAFEELFQWVGHVHIEDIADSRAHNHLIPGLGAIDFAAVFRAMERTGYDGHISLELYPYVDRPEAAGRESLSYLKPLFRESGLPVDI